MHLTASVERFSAGRPYMGHFNLMQIFAGSTPLLLGCVGVLEKKLFMYIGTNEWEINSHRLDFMRCDI
jgi:hypothetical protein